VLPINVFSVHNRRHKTLNMTASANPVQFTVTFQAQLEERERLLWGLAEPLYNLEHPDIVAGNSV
jgi:hypothetical protein